MACQLRILIAEDDDNDAFLLRRAFTKAGVAHELVIARDGQEVIEYLSRAAGSDAQDTALPSLLLMDLNMPRRDGFDLLAWLKSQPNLQQMPAVVLSNSDEPIDVEKARSLGAADYHVKPSNFNDLITMVKTLSLRWLPAG
jgi:CheY-like chemotaxis protein